MEMELTRINERTEKLQQARQKKEADLAILDDEEDDFKVKISLKDYELLKEAKVQASANNMLMGGFEQQQNM